MRSQRLERRVPAGRAASPSFLKVQGRRGTLFTCCGYFWTGRTLASCLREVVRARDECAQRPTASSWSQDRGRSMSAGDARSWGRPSEDHDGLNRAVRGAFVAHLQPVPKNQRRKEGNPMSL